MVLEDFQRMLESDFGMPKVVTPWPPNHEAAQDRRPDPLLLNRKHYELARDRLLVECELSDTSALIDINRRRLIVLALVVLILLRHTGARLSEILGLRFSDVLRVGGRIDLVIRPSRFRRLKTGAARRRIRIDHRLSLVEKGLLERWLESEHLRQTQENAGSVLVFSAMGADISLVSSDSVRKTIQAAFESSSSTQMWPPLLRHLWASEEIPNAFRSDQDPECVWTTLPPPERVRALELRRHEIGHAWLSTSFQHYVHTAHGLKRRCEQGHLEAAVDRWTLAGYSGLSVDNIYKVRQRRLGDLETGDPMLAGRWHAATAERQKRVGKAVSPAAAPNISSPLVLPTIAPATLWDLSRLLRTASDPRKLEIVALSFGLSDRNRSRLIAAVDRLGRKVHFRIFEGVTRRGSISRNPKARFTNPRQLQSWLMRFDLALLPGLAAAFEASFSPFDARRDCLTGNREQLESIRSALGLSQTALINGASASNEAVLQFERQAGRIGVFHQACWALAIAWVWVDLQS